MMQFLKYTLAVLVVLALTAVAVVWVAFGRGQPYPDLSGTPRLPEGTIEAAVTSNRPIGNATVSADGRIHWADALSLGPDGWPYLSDSAIPELVLQSAANHAEKAPHYVWRFRPGTSGTAGQ
jgi:hypothetical protein